MDSSAVTAVTAVVITNDYVQIIKELTQDNPDARKFLMGNGLASVPTKVVLKNIPAL